MKNILISALLLTALSASAFGAKKNLGISDQKVKSLLAKLEEKREKRAKAFSKLDTKLVRFFLSPSQPKQGENVVVFAQIASRFLDSDTFLEATFDSSPVALEKSAAELWAYDAGSFPKMGSHSFTANVYIQDTAAATEIKNAITALDAAIASLNEQIDQETDEVTRNQLIAQRDQKISQKNELIEALNGLKKSIASETYSFSIEANPGVPGVPHISSASPTVGPIDGGTFVTVTGSNFVSGMEGKLGGLPVSLSFVSSTELNFTTPDFQGNGGAKDLEISVSGPNEANTVRKNAFFAIPGLISNTRPVAVAGASQSVNVGALTSLSGSSSYDDNGHAFTYAWKAISVPAGSGIDTGVVHSTEESFDFTPTKPGAYVWELVLTEVGTDPALVSEPSLTVVTANAPANTAPAPSADSITLMPEDQASRQIAHGDMDDYQSHVYVITKQSAYGTATISDTGLLTFTAGTADGSDSIEVAVVDNGSPPLKGTVSIPVNVATSVVTLDDLYYTIRTKDGLIGVDMGADTISSSNGTIVSAVWSFGDGTSQPSYFAATDGAFITHDYLTPGTYTASVTVTDSLGATATKSQSVVIGSSDVPVARVSADVISGSVPLTVSFDTSASTDDAGITNFRWRWGDGSPNQNTTSTSISHTFNNQGNYRVRVSLFDADGNRSDGFVDIYAGTTPPAEGSRPQSVIRVSSREIILSNSHSFSGLDSFDPNPLGSIVDYRWNFGDFTTCDGAHATPGCEATGATTGYTFPEARNYQVSLEVEGASGGVHTAAKEVYVVNSGHAPRAVPAALEHQGIAPFTVNFDATSSFDYDGTIVSYDWDFDDSICTSGCTATSATASFTYNDPGVYFPSIIVTDNDGNKHESTLVVFVDSASVRHSSSAVNISTSGAKAEDVFSRRKEIFACFKGNSASCFEAAKMYRFDGKKSVASKLFEKACAMGDRSACSRQ